MLKTIGLFTGIPAAAFALLRRELSGRPKGQKDSTVFREIRQRLNRLPPAKSMPRR